MDDARAAELLHAERARVTALLAEMDAEVGSDRSNEDESGDWADRAQPLTAEGADGAVAAQLHERLEAIGRADARLAAGTYGRSVRSDDPIPDERLEADPTAELTVGEAAEP